ncbi:hypothetical protein GOB93_17945 [Acetobacter musti]|uniref:Uncharacterized protein n=1 Tax=Acetobacter musti TaxID=864732 RepID=A0ABX0JTH6_9PROT|nr:hypothetical protein [Acetobacter musti]NHN86501.1 hypothetical protein [Acetobacter musti]
MSEYFFDGWLGLLDANRLELTVSGYSRVPVRFTALNGSRDTRPVTQPIISTEAAWPLACRLALFLQASGDDLPVLHWQLSRWTLGGTINSFAVPETDSHLLLNSPGIWPPGIVVGQSAAGEDVTVGSDISWLPGASTPAV